MRRCSDQQSGAAARWRLLAVVAAPLLTPAGCRQAPAPHAANIEVLADVPVVRRASDSTTATIHFQVRNASKVVRRVAACIGRIQPIVEQRVGRRWMQRSGHGCLAIGAPDRAIRPGEIVDGAVRAWSAGDYRLIVSEFVPPNADPVPRYVSNVVRVR